MRGYVSPARAAPSIQVSSILKATASRTAQPIRTKMELKSTRKSTTDESPPSSGWLRKAARGDKSLGCLEAPETNDAMNPLPQMARDNTKPTKVVQLVVRNSLLL